MKTIVFTITEKNLKVTPEKLEVEVGEDVSFEFVSSDPKLTKRRSMVTTIIKFIGESPFKEILFKLRPKLRRRGGPMRPRSNRFVIEGSINLGTAEGIGEYKYDIIVNQNNDTIYEVDPYIEVVPSKELNAIENGILY